MGRWRGQATNPALGGVVELSIKPGRTCEVRIGRSKRLRARGFPRAGGGAVTVQLWAGSRDNLSIRLSPGIRGILRSELVGQVQGVPIREHLRLIKISSSP